MIDLSERIAAQNVALAMREGPGLKFGYRVFVGGIRGQGDTEEVLLSGLGGLGVGQMWFPAKGNRRKPGYRKAKAGWRFDFARGWHRS